MKKFAIALVLLALMGGLLGTNSAQAGAAPTASLVVFQNMGQLTVTADPFSTFMVWDTNADGTRFPVTPGAVDPSGCGHAMVPMTYGGPNLIVGVWGPNGGMPVYLIVEKDDRWIWD